MARPRTPAHLKPVPTTVSMTPENRRWLDEHHGGNVSRFVNAAVADFRRANDLLQDAKDHRARTARRVAAIHAGHSDAVDAALSLLGGEDDPEVTARLCAMLLSRVQRLGIEGANAAPHLLVALEQAINHNETPEGFEQIAETKGSYMPCDASVHNRPCKRKATLRVRRPDGDVRCYCTQHAKAFAAHGTTPEAV